MVKAAKRTRRNALVDGTVMWDGGCSAKRGFRDCTRAVSRVAKSPEGSSPLVSDLPDPEVGIDWLRMTGPAGKLSRLMRVCERVWGDGYEHKDRGLWSYRESFVWEGGPKVLFSQGGDNDTCAVEVTGKVLSEMDGSKRLQLARVLWKIGLRPSRLDIAVDYKGKDLTLVADAVDAGEGFHYCRTRTFKAEAPKCGLQLTGHQANFGKRGSEGSGRMLRVYDKGLEQRWCVENGERREFDEGEWQRWEAELSDECASKALLQIMEAGRYGGAWEAEAASIALWAVEFRERKEGSRAREIARRPMLEWWRALVEGIRQVRVVKPRESTRFAGFADWFGKAVAPTLKLLSEESLATPAEVASWMIGDTGAKDIEKSGVGFVADFLRLFRSGSPPLTAA